jgi:DNA ligase-associated metallophosphoesterase
MRTKSYKTITLKIGRQHFELHPLKAVYWQEQGALLIADIHLGKVTHFRKAGIAVPRDKMNEDLFNLEQLMDHFDPEKVYFLGDLFHSDYNSEAGLLESFVDHYSGISFHLVIGNHDLPGFRRKMEGHLEIHEKIALEGYSLQHHPDPDATEGFQFCGHIHPAVRLRNTIGQSTKLPCFYLTDQMLILPSFGSFTGNKTINVKKGDRVFVTANNSVVEMSAR